MISTRGRYALRVMIDLAEHQNGSFIPMKDVAERQGFSLKYIEKIMPVLSKHKMVEGQHGKGGGYRLTSDPREYRVLDILKITEGNLAPVACLEKNAKPCSRIGECRTIGMWRKFHELTLDLFANITIADLMQKEELPDNYVI